MTTPIAPTSMRDATRLAKAAGLWIWTRRRIAALGAVIGTISGVIVMSITPVTYTSSVSMVSRGAGGLSGAQSIAAQLGVSLSGDPTQLTSFFAAIATTRDVLISVSRFPVPRAPGSKDSTTIAAEVAGSAKSPRDSDEKAISFLRAATKISSAQRTGILKIDVSARNPRLAFQAANAFIEGLDKFNRERLKTQAREERNYLERRLSEAQAELFRAEDSLAVFVGRNRVVTSSPMLAIEQQRLQRQLNIRQTTYGALVNVYEQARLSELRDTPQISVIEYPVEALGPDDSRRWIVVVGLFVGLIALPLTWPRFRRK